MTVKELYEYAVSIGAEDKVLKVNVGWLKDVDFNMLRSSLVKVLDDSYSVHSLVIDVSEVTEEVNSLYDEIEYLKSKESNLDI